MIRPTSSPSTDGSSSLHTSDSHPTVASHPAVKHSQVISQSTAFLKSTIVTSQPVPNQDDHFLGMFMKTAYLPLNRGLVEKWVGLLDMLQMTLKPVNELTAVLKSDPKTSLHLNRIPYLPSMVRIRSRAGRIF